MRLGALALALAASTASAQEPTDLAPERAPTPATRPGDAVPQLIPPEEPGTSAPDASQDEVPQLIPPGDRPRSGEAVDREPDDEEDAPSAGPEESGESDAPVGPPMRELLAESPAELSACLAALDAMGATYERADPIEDSGNPDCGIANPLTVSEVVPGVALDPPPTLRCEAALAAARWVADVALPLSRKIEGRGPLTVIDQAPAYLCRPRADGETSEHAFGNALDVMGFRFKAGDPIPVEPRAGDGTLEEAFQRAVRAGACLDFTTVLGPGQEDHADHLHLDVKERENGFRICQ